MISYVLAAVALVIVVRALGRRPFVILGRRLTGRGPGRPPWTEPGAERWFALGAVVLLIGLGVAAYLSRPVGYSIAALGLLAVAYTGVLVALDRNGAARAFVRRFWTEQGITVPAPMIQMRIMGGGWWSSGSSASRSCSERRSGESVRGLGGTLAAGAVGGAVGGAYNAAGTQIGVTPTQVGMGAIAGTAGGMAGGRSGLLLLRRSGERWSSSDRLGL